MLSGISARGTITTRVVGFNRSLLVIIARMNDFLVSYMTYIVFSVGISACEARYHYIFRPTSKFKVGC